MRVSRPAQYVACAALVVVVCLLVPVQPAAAERERDFAKGLMDRGYLDLAIQQYQRLLALPKISAAERASAHFDLATIYQTQADAAKALADRQALLVKARAELSAALKASKSDVVLVFRARQQQAVLLQNNARHLSTLLNRSDFAGDREKTRSEALKAFAESATAFRTLSKDAQALIARVEKERKPGWERVRNGLQNERVNAMLSALWSEYYAALLFGPKEAERTTRLEKAAKGFAAFAKDWDGFLICLYGHLGEGACLLNLGRHEKARAKFSIVLQARRLKAARPVCVEALIYRATSYNATDQATQALEDLDSALEFFPTPERDELGRRALLEKARAKEQVATQLRAQDPEGGQWQSVAREALQAARRLATQAGAYTGEALAITTRLLAALGADKAASAPESLAVADLAIKEKAYNDAITAYRRAIELSSQADSPVAVRAWFGIARAYYYMKLYREAAIVFEYVGREFAGTDEGPRAAYLGVQCWSLAYNQSRLPAELDATVTSLDRSLQRYRDNPQVVELRMLQGRLLLQDGRYEEALRSFQAIPETGVGYARAQYEAGMCAYDWFIDLFKRGKLGDDKGKAQYETAVKHLRTYLKLVKPATMTTDEKERAGNARVVLATIYGDVMGDSRTALTFVQGFAFPPALEAQVLPLKLKGLIQQGEVDQALAMLKKARAGAGTEPGRFQEVLGMIGQALDDQAEALRKSGDESAYRAAAKRTADFLLKLIRDNPDQEASMYYFVATRLIRIERYDDASDILGKLISRFGADPKNEAVVLSARLSLVECLMGSKAWDRAIDQLTELRGLNARYARSARLKRLLATCYIRSGQPKLGIPLLEDLLKKVYKAGTRPWYEVGLDLGRAYEQTGQKQRALSITGYTKVLDADFWAGRDRDNADLAEQYRELHKRCGGT